MGEHEERVAFDGRHASEVIEIIALIGERAGGAGKTGGAVLWTPSADMLAHIDEHDTVVASKGRLSWLATDAQRGTWIHDLKPLTQYTLRVRRATPDPSDSAEHGMPVPDRSHDFALEEVVKRGWSQPVVASDGSCGCWRLGCRVRG